MLQSPLRLRRVTDPKSGRAVLLSFTAGMEIGLVPGLADLPAAVGAMAAPSPPTPLPEGQRGVGMPRLTGAVVHAGAVAGVVAKNPDLPCGIVVDLFGGTWMTTRPERREQICSIEHAVRVGADAVLATISLGSRDEAHQLRVCGQIARECAAWGMPFVVRVDTTETDAARQYSATLSGHGARLAYELGADLVAVNYSGSPDTFREALRGIDIPVLVSGSPRMESDEPLLQSVRDALAAGASGVCLPAPLFWHEGPSPALDSVARAVLGV